MKTVLAALSSILLLPTPAARAAEFGPVSCEGAYTHHLQGVCTDEKDALFWCFTTTLVKTDRTDSAAVEPSRSIDHSAGVFFSSTSVQVSPPVPRRMTGPVGAVSAVGAAARAGDASPAPTTRTVKRPASRVRARRVTRTGYGAGHTTECGCDLPAPHRRLAQRRAWPRLPALPRPVPASARAARRVDHHAAAASSRAGAARRAGREPAIRRIKNS